MIKKLENLAVVYIYIYIYIGIFKKDKIYLIKNKGHPLLI